MKVKVICKDPFFLYLYTFPSKKTVNVKINWWNFINTWNDMSYNNTQNFSAVSHHLRELLDFESWPDSRSLSWKSNNSLEWWQITLRIFLWSLGIVFKMCAKFNLCSVPLRNITHTEWKKNMFLKWPWRQATHRTWGMPVTLLRSTFFWFLSMTKKTYHDDKKSKKLESSFHACFNPA